MIAMTLANALLSIATAGVLNDQLTEFNLELKDEGAWTIQKNSGASAGDKKMRNLTLESGEISLELALLKPLTAVQLEQETKTEYVSILSAYKTAATPYQGAVSSQLTCGKEFFPKDLTTEFAGQKARALFGFGTDRKTFGVCSHAEAKTEFAFVATGLPGDVLVKVTGFRKRRHVLDVKSWKNLLAQFKFKPSGGSIERDHTKAKSP